MKCVCEKWERTMPTIDSIFVLNHIHGGKFDGDEFIYCPWCGKELEKDE